MKEQIIARVFQNKNINQRVNEKKTLQQLLGESYNNKL